MECLVRTKGFLHRRKQYSERESKVQQKPSDITEDQKLLRKSAGVLPAIEAVEMVGRNEAQKAGIVQNTVDKNNVADLDPSRVRRTVFGLLRMTGRFVHSWVNCIIQVICTNKGKCMK